MPADVYRVQVALPLAKAREVVHAVLEEARRRELEPLTVTVLDAGAQPVAMEREDGAGTLRPRIAHGKAAAALGLGLSSGTVGKRNEGREAFLGGIASAAPDAFIPAPGGVLILDRDSRVIGAVGVTGDAPDQDEACALAGIGAAGLTPGIDPAAD